MIEAWHRRSGPYDSSTPLVGDLGRWADASGGALRLDDGELFRLSETICAAIDEGDALWDLLPVVPTSLRADARRYMFRTGPLLLALLLVKPGSTVLGRETVVAADLRIVLAPGDDRPGA